MWTWWSSSQIHGDCRRRSQNAATSDKDSAGWSASLVAILATRFPDKTPQLMAYMKTIVKAQRTFMGKGWVTYDTCFRRKAAIIKSLDWGEINFTASSETFTGRAKAVAHCRHCSSDLHAAHECAFGTPPSLPATHPPRDLQHSLPRYQ